MALATIQNFVLNLTIDPTLADRFYADPKSVQAEFQLTDEEVQWASQMPRDEIEAFQGAVAAKRSRRAESFFARTNSMIKGNRRLQIFRDFSRKQVMRANNWTQSVVEYLDHVATYMTGDSRQEAITRDLIHFEKWLYLMTREEMVEQTGGGYVVSANVRVEKFPFPAEPLITDQVNRANLALTIDGYGTIGYVLAQKVGTQVDLYAIDECYYNFIQASSEPCSLEELTARAQATAQALGLEKSPQDMIAELQEFGIVIQLGEVK